MPTVRQQPRTIPVQEDETTLVIRNVATGLYLDGVADGAPLWISNASLCWGFGNILAAETVVLCNFNLQTDDIAVEVRAHANARDNRKGGRVAPTLPSS